LYKILLLFIIFLSPNFLFSQEDTLTERAMNSTIDQGWYWDNSFRGRWNPFGACYRTKIYYRNALYRDQNTFWFADSVLDLGMEQSIASSARTSLFMFWQPIIAVNFLFKVGYSKDFVKGAALKDAYDDYSHALPPFTGQNPGGRKPVRLDADTLEIEFAPTFTFGGPLGSGMMALIYTPTMLYFHNFGLDPNQYFFHNREAVVLKAQDIFWRHDIKLGYMLSGTGMSFAFTGLIEHVQSIKGIFRAGIFGSFSYEKASEKYPNLIPYFKTQVGTWIKDRYMDNYFALQFETGVKWKFN